MTRSFALPSMPRTGSCSPPAATGAPGYAIAGEHRDEHLHYRAAHLAIRLSTIYPELAEGAVAHLNAVARRVGAPTMFYDAAQRQGTVHLLVERLPDRVTAAEAYRRARSMAIAAGSVHAEVYATSSLAMALLLGDTPPDAECRQLLRRACDSRLWIFAWSALEFLANNLLCTGNAEAGAVRIGNLQVNYIPFPAALTQGMRRHAPGPDRGLRPRQPGW